MNLVSVFIESHYVFKIAQNYEFFCKFAFFRKIMLKQTITTMIKRLFIMLGLASVLSFAATSCNETPQQEPEDDPINAPVAPNALIAVTSLDRTSVSFSIISDSPGDYAWKIVKGTENFADAEALFNSGTTGMFGSDNKISVTDNNLEGGNEYTLYYAVRKINPYVYSELYKESISTDFPYEDMITLEKVTTNAVSYHIEKPEGAKAYRHMIVDYNDYVYIKALVGATYDSYLSAFGAGATESKTFSYEWFQPDDVWGSYPTHFYSDTKYLILAGESETTGIDGQVSADKVKYIEFKTPKAEVCPYKLDIQISDVTSLSADVTVTPEEGVDRYRMFVMSEADYESFLFEGEEMVRRVVIGEWNDLSTEFRGEQSLALQGLVPNTNYYVCAVVFDKDMRELYVEKIFTTTEPVGPAPEIEVTAVETEEPWHTAAANLKIKNAVSAISFVHTKYAVDEVLNRPGNEGLTIEDVINTNGVSLSSAEIAKASSEEGATLQFAGLSPNTEYIYAIKATNSEYVSTSYAYHFKTGAEPVIETTLFGKLKGEYTAKITDVNGVPHTFDVTITDGVNAATREAYRAENILVCLGFDACGVEYNSPEDLLAKGWAKDEEEANRNYGPKWFLEVDENDNITTYKHAVASTSYDEVNQAELIDYSADGEAPMASFNDQTLWFKGTFNRYYSSKDEWKMQATTLIHNVTYDDEAGKITVHPVTHFKSWSSRGESITEYPGVSQSKNWYGGSDSKVIFCGNSSLVLTRKQPAKAQKSQAISPMNKPLVTPSVMTFDVQENRRTLRRR